MEINLDLRLYAIYEFLRNDKIIADIGTDHGYLPVYSIINNKSKFAYCCDVNEKPLQKAKDLIEKFNVKRQATTVLSNGLEKLPRNCCDDIVLAGMGFDLINDILSACDWIKNSNINLILQPMTKHEMVRKYLCDNSFKIVDEKAIIDDNKIYAIICATFCDEILTQNQVDFYLGCHLNKANYGEINSQKYVLSVLNKLKLKSEGLKKSKRNNHLTIEIDNLIDKINSLINFKG